MYKTTPRLLNPTRVSKRHIKIPTCRLGKPPSNTQKLSNLDDGSP